MATSTRKSTQLPQTEQDVYRQLWRIRREQAELMREEFSLKMHLSLLRYASR